MGCSTTDERWLKIQLTRVHVCLSGHGRTSNRPRVLNMGTLQEGFTQSIQTTRATTDVTSRDVGACRRSQTT